MTAPHLKTGTHLLSILIHLQKADIAAPPMLGSALCIYQSL